jgi:hypothetical protein
MGLCTGCAVLFHGLDGPVCMKCVKLAGAHSSTEREVINVSSMLPLMRLYLFKLQKQPQCEKCSVVYPYMKNVICGGCMDGELQFRTNWILAQPDSVQVPASSARDGEYYLHICLLHLAKS